MGAFRLEGSTSAESSPPGSTSASETSRSGPTTSSPPGSSDTLSSLLQVESWTTRRPGESTWEERSWDSSSKPLLRHNKKDLEYKLSAQDARLLCWKCFTIKSLWFISEK